jgi:hypothetical protein
MFEAGQQYQAAVFKLFRLNIHSLKQNFIEYRKIREKP